MASQRQAAWRARVGVCLSMTLVACADRLANEISHPTAENLPPPGSPVVRSGGNPLGIGEEALSDWLGVRDALIEGGDVLFSLGRLGEMHEDGPEVFGIEIDVAIDPSGQLLVLDRRNHAIKTFDTLGQHIATFGRAGPGPGEFLDPVALESMADGRLVVLDRGNRINIYAPSAAGYDYSETHVVAIVPETACSADGRVFVSGWRQEDNTMIHEIPVSQSSVEQHFGRGYVWDHWLAQDQLSDGPIACLGDPLRVILAFERVPVVRAYAADRGTLLWTAILEDYLQPPIFERFAQDGQPTIFSSAEGVRDMVTSLTPVSERHVLLQTLRFEPSPYPDFETRSYLIDAESGEGAFVTNALPLVALASLERYVATWLLPYPRLELRTWDQR